MRPTPGGNGGTGPLVITIGDYDHGANSRDYVLDTRTRGCYGYTMTTQRIALKDLNANDVFTMTEDPNATPYVCVSRYFPGIGQGGTRIVYRLYSTVADMNREWVFVKPSLTDVYVSV